MRRVLVYGYRGVRVGEASHPGPLHRLHRGSDRSRSPATRVTGLRRFCDDDQPWEPRGQGVSEVTVLDSPTGEVTQLDPSSRESTSDSDDGREWSVVLQANRRASTSDTVSVSPALNAVDTGRFAVLAEQSQSKRMRVRESQATTVAAPFLEIADARECDLTRGDTDVGSHQQSESDTESVGHNMVGAPPRRRLRLTWNVPGAASASHRDTRAVSNLFE